MFRGVYNSCSQVERGQCQGCMIIFVWKSAGDVCCVGLGASELSGGGEKNFAVAFLGFVVGAVNAKTLHLVSFLLVINHE